MLDAIKSIPNFVYYMTFFTFFAIAIVLWVMSKINSVIKEEREKGGEDFGERVTTRVKGLVKDFTWGSWALVGLIIVIYVIYFIIVI